MVDEMEALGIPWEVTRRGALRGMIGGRAESPNGSSSAISTLGAMVTQLKDNGRLAITKVGWSSRFAEGRVSISPIVGCVEAPFCR